MGLPAGYVTDQLVSADPEDNKSSVRFATTAALAAYTRTANVIQADANGALGDQDGVTPVAGDSLLLTTGAAPEDNGVYEVTQLGDGSNPFILTRRQDANASAKVTAGMATRVEEGVQYGPVGTKPGRRFVLITPNPIVLNTTGLDFRPVADISDGDWQQSVLDKDLTAPPGGESVGDRYIVGGSATGAWTGHDDEIAEWGGANWSFSVPTEGTFVWVEDEDTLYVFDGKAWVLYSSGGGVEFGALISGAGPHNLESGRAYVVAAGGETLVFPASPENGDEIILLDADGVNLTLDGNGNDVGHPEKWESTAATRTWARTLGVVHFRFDASVFGAWIPTAYWPTVGWSPNASQSSNVALANASHEVKVEGDATFTVTLPDAENGTKVLVKEVLGLGTGAITIEGSGGRDVERPDGSTGVSEVITGSPRFWRWYKLDTVNDLWTLISSSPPSIEPQTLTPDTAITYDVLNGLDAYVLLDEAHTQLNWVYNGGPLLPGQAGRLTLQQDGSGLGRTIASYLINGAALVTFPNGPPVLSTGSGARDVFDWWYDGQRLHVVPAIGMEISGRTASTTSTTPEVIATHAMAINNRVMLIKATIIALQTAGAGAGNAAKYSIEGFFRRDGGGTVTQKGVDDITVLFEDDPSWDVDFNIAGTIIQLRVTGISTDNINWRVVSWEVVEHG